MDTGMDMGMGMDTDMDMDMDTSRSWVAMGVRSYMDAEEGEYSYIVGVLIRFYLQKFTVTIYKKNTCHCDCIEIYGTAAI